MENDTSLWWYEHNGQRNGPVRDSGIEKLIEDGQLNQDNLVWKEGMQTWVAIHATPFSLYTKSNVPPPITGDAVNNNIVWWLAFAPIIGQLLQGFFLEIAHPTPTADAGLGTYFHYLVTTDFNEFWFITLALNVWLCYKDEKYLKKAGHDTSKFGSTWLIPFYLYRRAQILRQNNAYFWVWLITFIITIG